MNELQQAHKLVWDFRREMEPYWATPEPLDALRYAFTECGEAMDAWLREQRPNDSRNNQRESSVLDELADCAIMLLTAINPDHIPPEHVDYWELAEQTRKPVATRLEKLCGITASALMHARDDVDGYSKLRYEWVSGSFLACAWIATHPNMDLLPRIQMRLGRIVAKHCNDPKRAWKIIQNLLGLENPFEPLPPNKPASSG